GNHHPGWPCSPPRTAPPACAPERAWPRRRRTSPRARGSRPEGRGRRLSSPGHHSDERRLLLSGTAAGCLRRRITPSCITCRELRRASSDVHALAGLPTGHVVRLAAGVADLRRRVVARAVQVAVDLVGHVLVAVEVLDG